MTFIKTVIPEPIHGRKYDEVFWTSGIYKIVPYSHLSEFGGRPGFAAYYKPDGWANWGMRVDPRRSFYRTWQEARRACEAHERAARQAA